MPSASLTSALQPAIGLLKRLTTIPPKESKMTVGLDIGSSAIKVVVLGQRKTPGPRPIVGHHLLPLKAGQDADASEAVKSAVATLQLPVNEVSLSVSGQWVIMRVVEMPVMKSGELSQALPFEAQRYLPFSVQEVVIDGAILGPSEANKQWVLIVACKRELLTRRIDWVKRAGLEPVLVDVDALAVANAVLSASNGASAEAKKGTRAVIDVGARLTNLVIFRGQSPYLVRDIPWGGEKLTRHIADQLGTEAATIAKELAQGAVSPELQNAMKLTCEALVSELQLSFDYFENRFGQAPESVLVSGGWSQSVAFVEALKGYFPQSVTQWSPARELSGQFAVAYGLALRTP